MPVHFSIRSHEKMPRRGRVCVRGGGQSYICSFSWLTTGISVSSYMNRFRERARTDLHLFICSSFLRHNAYLVKVTPSQFLFYNETSFPCGI